MNRDLVKKLKEQTIQPTLQRNPNEFTRAEFAREFGLKKSAADMRLKRLVAAGVIVPTKVSYLNKVGVVTTCLGYRYVGDPNAGRSSPEGA